MCFSNVNSNINKNLALFQLRWDLTPSVSYPRDKKKVTWRQPPLTWVTTSPLFGFEHSATLIKTQSTFVFLKSSHHLKLTWNPTKLVFKIIPLRNTYIYCLLLSIVQDNFGILLELTSKLFIHTHTHTLVSSFHCTHLMDMMIITLKQWPQRSKQVSSVFCPNAK